MAGPWTGAEAAEAGTAGAAKSAADTDSAVAPIALRRTEDMGRPFRLSEGAGRRRSGPALRPESGETLDQGRAPGAGVRPPLRSGHARVPRGALLARRFRRQRTGSMPEGHRHRRPNHDVPGRSSSPPTRPCSSSSPPVSEAAVSAACAAAGVRCDRLVAADYWAASNPPGGHEDGELRSAADT